MGKDKESTASRLASPMPTPAADSTDADEGVQGTPPVDDEQHVEGVESGEVAEKEDGEDVESFDAPLSLKPSTSAASHSGTPLSSQRDIHSRKDLTPFNQTEDDDIEMGEVAEDPKQIKMKRKIREELEEGEASDSSSALSDPPDE